MRFIIINGIACSDNILTNSMIINVHERNDLLSTRRANHMPVIITSFHEQWNVHPMINQSFASLMSPANHASIHFLIEHIAHHILTVCPWNLKARNPCSQCDQSNLVHEHMSQVHSIAHHSRSSHAMNRQTITQKTPNSSGSIRPCQSPCHST